MAFLVVSNIGGQLKHKSVKTLEEAFQSIAASSQQEAEVGEHSCAEEAAVEDELAEDGAESVLGKHTSEEGEDEDEVAQGDEAEQDDNELDEAEDKDAAWVRCT